MEIESKQQILERRRENVLELVSDAWNYFPHKIIGGLSPAEKLLEYRERHG